MTPAANSTQGKQGTDSPDTRFIMRIASEIAVVIVIGLLITKLLDVTLLVLTQDLQPAHSWDGQAAVPRTGSPDQAHALNG